ncbi:Cell division protein FtsB [Kingella potus]|uniref:Cell division protein FtsB n=1 Tax=Kingella potus TaxID=265175 RepID=A0A377R5M5_9NEIS|nr:cell division protein FtsB [Kingella potus]UOO99994.1 cell division protein FtsB [Kingella potus]STR03282.1 Cell division protein FtsB [Kingella potus]
MKWTTLVLLAALGHFQYKLWVGKGSYEDVAQMEQRVRTRVASNQILQLRNNALAAEVADLQSGSDAIEEIARTDLGYIAQGEIYYRLVKPAE